MTTAEADVIPITLKEMAQAFEARDRRYYALFEHAPISMWKIDYSECRNHLIQHCPKNLISCYTYLADHPEIVEATMHKIIPIDANKAAVKSAQFSDKIMLLENMAHFYQGEMLDKFRHVADALYHGKTSVEFEVSMQTAMGKEAIILLSFAVLPGYEETYKKVIVSTVDQTHSNLEKEALKAEVDKRLSEVCEINDILKQEIIERKVMEQELRISEKRYRKLSSICPVGIYHYDDTGNCIYVNQYFEGIFGASFDAVKNGGWIDFLYPEDRDRVVKEWEAFIAFDSTFDIKYRLQRPDGTIRWVYDKAIAERDPDGNPIQFIGTMTDITQLLSTQEKLRQSQINLAHFSRMDFMSEIGTGIAHELSQPLTAIINYAGGCYARLQKANVAPDVIEVSQRVLKQAERAGAILKSLKNFLKKGESEKEFMSVNDSIDTVLMFVGSGFADKNIEVTLHLNLALPDVYADHIQIEQVLLNLIQNAIDAMSELPSENRRLIIESNYEENSYVTVTITDSGPGVPEDLANNIFNPFVTTKSKGMGVGLALSHSLVEAHEGQLTLERSYTEGARFMVYLPANKLG